uniref:Complement component 1, s subcomponent n=1 Tax=Neogobius melanostomus TaxID=47308 RepID=A0A8C6UX14_9GOBI
IFSFLVVVVLFCPWVSPSLLGWVESPGYPRGYPSHTRFNWSRCAPEGHTLSIQLMHLDLEDSYQCENDAVKVTSNGNLISVLCGKKPFEELQSSVNPQLRSRPGGCLYLSFHSDYSDHHRHAGFRGFYTTQDYDECEDPENSCTQFCHNYIGGYYCSCHHGYHLDRDNHTCTVSCTEDLSGQSSGQVSSPSWPGLYPENSRCEFSLSVDPELQLQLHFSQPFDVEQSPDGESPTSPLFTHSHQVKILFESDGYGTNSGFSLSFQTKDKVCLGTVSPHSKTEPLKAEFRRGQVVTVTCDTGHFVNIVTKEYETTCQSTGDWTPHYICQAVNCGRPDIPKDDILVVVESEKPNTLYKSQVKFNCSSPYYTLEGDDTYTCGPNGEWLSTGNDVELPKCIEVCGMPQTSSATGQIPWYLLIKEPNRGGASLINDRWAVTAAHVVDHDEFEPLWYGGIVDGRSKDAVELQTEKIIIHPSDMFQKCQATPGVNMQYTQNMFCAGDDGKDSCEKDSGGPYFVPTLDAGLRPFRLMGIVSWGASCDQRQHKGYYTKVENYVQWIRDTIEATEESLKQQESE